MRQAFDAIMITSFGGPEGMKDVLPFLENVLRGKNVPLERKMEVAEIYERFGGVSPINSLNRAVQKLLQSELQKKGIPLKVYFGNRNWTPYLKEALLEMKRDGVKKALTYITSPFASYSGCRQYLEDIEKARGEIGEGAPVVERTNHFYNHPAFIDLHLENIQKSFLNLPETERKEAHLLFTAHSIPIEMSKGSDYLAQLEEVSSKLAKQLKISKWKLVFQSRSGPPTQAWLEPDINAYLTNLKNEGVKAVVVSPIGFVSDHLEVIFDLDIQAKEKAQKLGILFERAATPGNHPRYIQMLIDLISERLNGQELLTCKSNCCAYKPMRP